MEKARQTNIAVNDLNCVRPTQFSVI